MCNMFSSKEFVSFNEFIFQDLFELVFVIVKVEKVIAIVNKSICLIF